MTAVRPDLGLLWPSFTLFPLAGLAVLGFGIAGHDPVMTTIGAGLVVLNALVVFEHAWWTELRIEGDALVHRTRFGTRSVRLPIGSLQRIDAKRYPAAHSGVSAPHFVARGRDTTLKVNTKPYRLRDLAALIGTLRAANPRIELDPFWGAVVAGEDIRQEAARTPRSRW